jgi:peptide deformylase
VRGLKAATYQHEVDHLDGLLFLDRVEDSRTLSTWDSFNEFHKEAFVERVTALVAKHGS